ncbi:serine/threonine protein kinase [Trichocoleus desertorum AS-A10]|uniref:serine/threonine-protein kinase n=1 Tax=Trichocoleus desertorum TaxID=1481672 RepID=UPI003298A589
MSINQDWLRQEFPDISELSPIAEGGQKWVFSGKHAKDGDVVLKICLRMHPERIARETQAVQSIKSPRVPKILALGTAQANLGEVVWIREEKIFGDNLRDYLQNSPLDSRAVLRLGKHLLEALAYAEQARIVHRDVKPENILVDLNSDFWLLDFGLSRHLDLTSLTATASPRGVGTWGYAPPEQFRNQKSEIDSRVDLFALGVTLYECVEGINPFRYQARDEAEVFHRIESMPLPAISKPIDAANEFKDLVFAMTRARRDHRLESAKAALEWIQEICDREGLA